MAMMPEGAAKEMIKADIAMNIKMAEQSQKERETEAATVAAAAAGESGTSVAAAVTLNQERATQQETVPMTATQEDIKPNTVNVELRVDPSASGGGGDDSGRTSYRIHLFTRTNIDSFEFSCPLFPNPILWPYKTPCFRYVQSPKADLNKELFNLQQELLSAPRAERKRIRGIPCVFPLKR